MSEPQTCKGLPFSALGCTQRVRDLFEQQVERCKTMDSRDEAGETSYVLGRVIKLDRGFPLVATEQGSYRTEHAVNLVKTTSSLAAVGDWVVLSCPVNHEMPIIEAILERSQVFSRKEPGEKTGEQVLAANVDVVFALQSLSGDGVSIRHLEREMVIAYESGAQPVIVLTKADCTTALADDLAAVTACAGDVEVIVESARTGQGIEEVRAHLPQGTTGVLLGKSGVGKSTLVNKLVGSDAQAIGAVRASDGKGRHTTVAREMIAVPGGGVIIDTPGLRSLGLWGAHEGLRIAFADVATFAQSCHFRDCTHSTEPGCAVLEAVRSGELDQRRLDSYVAIAAEVEEVDDQKRVRTRLDRKGSTHFKGRPRN